MKGVVRWQNSNLELCSRLCELSRKKKVEKVHSQGKVAEKTSVGGPEKVVEMAWSSVENTNAQQQAQTQQRTIGELLRAFMLWRAR